MGEYTTISWAHATFNYIWGCVKVSPGCQHCYAETLSNRYGHSVWGPATTTPRRTMSDAYWDKPLAWNRKAEQAGTRTRVFCASMADVMEDHPIAQRERPRLWALIEQTPHLDWLLLTKRPENIQHMVPWPWLEQPRHNVWLGTSCEDQQRADERIPHLLKIPTVVRWLSCEPLLGPIDLSGWLLADRRRVSSSPVHAEPNIHWVVAGGESGAHARPMNPAWVRALRDHCQAAGVAFHFKQWGAHVGVDYAPEYSQDERQPWWSATGRWIEHAPPQPSINFGDGHGAVRIGTHAVGRLLDGREWIEFPVPSMEVP